MDFDKTAAVIFLLFLAPFFTAAQKTGGKNAESPSVQVAHFSVEQGLSDRNVSKILEDHQGYIWIATNKGLSRFDGYDFLTYDSRPRNPHKISTPWISDLLLEKSGKLLLFYHGVAEQIDLLDPSTGQLEPIKLEKNTGIYRIFQSSDGSIFIIRGGKNQLDICQFDERKRQFVLVFELPKVLQPTGFCQMDFLRAADGTFWMAFFQGKSQTIQHFDPAGKTLHSFEVKSPTQVGYFELLEPFLAETASGKIWFALADGGVQIWDSATAEVLKPHPLLRENTLAFAKDRAGNLLVYQQESNAIRKQCCYFFPADGSPMQDFNWIFEHQTAVWKPFGVDFRQGFFVGSNNGFFKYWLNPSNFSTFLNEKISGTALGISTRGIAKIGQDKLLVGTDRWGIFEINLAENQKPTRPAALLDSYETKGFVAQGDSIFWITNKNDLVKYTPATQTAQRFKNAPAEIWGIALDGNGSIWLADYDGHLFQFDSKTGIFNEFKTRDGSLPLAASQPTYLLAARDGLIWAGTALAGLIKINPKTRETQHFTANAGDPSGLNSNQIACIFEDSAGLLWIGTLEGGLHIFDPKIGKVTAVFTRENGLCNDNVVGILPDGKGNFWLSTFNGLSFFDTPKKTFRNYSTADGLTHNEFNRHSFFHDKTDGRFFFGGMNGVNAFYEKDLQPSENHFSMLLSSVSFAAENDSVVTRFEGFVNGSTLVLPPGNSFLNLHFALADYRNPAGNQFSYKIEGLDKDWKYLGNNRDLRLEHLPAGEFTLRVRGADNRGNWSSQEIALRLEVEEFWYRRWWAWLFYAAAVAAGVFFIYRFQLQRKIEQKEAHRLQELDAFKNRFFTNITHEFRTPLTVILGMTERLTANGERLTEAGNHGLNLIKRNGENLLRLINQILDLAKLEDKSLKINYVQGDVLAFLRYIAESLHSLANAQNLLLRVESEQSKIVMDYDPERLLQIVHNLLSNAIKFTPSGGLVILKANFGSSDVLEIAVSDSGVGIPPEELPRIFDRFFQAKNQEHAKIGGTGIGLSLTHELVKAMGGEISVESKMGAGTTFFVKLPMTRTALASIENQSFLKKMPFDLPMPTPSDEHPDSTPQVLLVEDNPDVVQYLSACLHEKYRLQFAFNGRAGIEKALEIVPDLIISDVMMPEKDGFEVCDFLKNDERTSHVPLILLTAKATVEDRIAGIRRGADAYLAKPFREEELLVWSEKLIAQRRNLQARYSKISAEIPVESAVVAPVELVLEDAFIQKFRGVLEANFSDTNFSVDVLCQKMAMSRTQIHRKLTALTDRSTTEHINSFRLEKARLLLLDGGLNVSEVAFRVGFNDPKYFSRLFSEAFGYPPSEVFRKAI